MFRASLVGEGLAPPAQNDVTLLLQRCTEDVAPYKSTFDISLVGEGFPLPLGNDVTFLLQRREQAPALHGCFATYTSSVGFADTFPKGKANDVAKLRDVLRCEKSYLNFI